MKLFVVLDLIPAWLDSWSISVFVFARYLRVSMGYFSGYAVLNHNPTENWRLKSICGNETDFLFYMWTRGWLTMILSQTQTQINKTLKNLLNKRNQTYRSKWKKINWNKYILFKINKNRYPCRALKRTAFLSDKILTNRKGNIIQFQLRHSIILPSLIKNLGYFISNKY